MDRHAHPRRLAGLLLALLLSPLTALAAGPCDVTAALAFPFAGVAHDVPPDRCRALGVGEEDVAFPTDPDHLTRVVSTIDFDATEVQVSVYSILDRITGIGLASGMPYHAQGEAINPIHRPDPALGAQYPIDPAFVFSPADPARASCTAPRNVSVTPASRGSIGPVDGKQWHRATERRPDAPPQLPNREPAGFGISSLRTCERSSRM